MDFRLGNAIFVETKYDFLLYKKNKKAVSKVAIVLNVIFFHVKMKTK